MPSYLLAAMLHATLHWLSPQARAIIDTLAHAAAGGRVLSPVLLATRLGLADRHHLARLLQREGLPTYRELAGWTRVLAWTVEWESAGTSLSRSALEVFVDPAVSYRLVKRLTGVGWRDVRRLGVPWVLARLRDRCRAPQARMYMLAERRVHPTRRIC